MMQISSTVPAHKLHKFQAIRCPSFSFRCQQASSSSLKQPSIFQTKPFISTESTRLHLANLDKLLETQKPVVPPTQIQHQPIINDPKEKKGRSFLEGLDLGRLWPEMKATDEMSPRHLKRLQRLLSMTGEYSPRNILGGRWREYHGSNDWKGMLDPLDENLRREVVRYGEFVQAAYQAFHSDPAMSTEEPPHPQHVALPDRSYRMTKSLYATSSIGLPKWVDEVAPDLGWMTQRSSWVGYVAVCEDRREIARMGRRDIIISLRGTSTCMEWAENLRAHMVEMGDEEGKAKVECGFMSLYKTKGAQVASLAESVVEEVRRLIDLYRGEELSISVIGHSLGATLALLVADEISTCCPKVPPVAVFSFGGPRVGNKAFGDRLTAKNVKVLRIVNSQDVITRVPGIFVSEELEQKIRNVGGGVLEENTPLAYSHVGTELRVQTKMSPYLKPDADMACCHDLEAYLHLVDGFLASNCPFRSNAKRSLARLMQDQSANVKKLYTSKAKSLTVNLSRQGSMSMSTQYGQVVDARIIMDRETGRHRGFGFITYSNVDEASRALQALDGQDLDGRRVEVKFAIERSHGFGGGGFGGSYGNTPYDAGAGTGHPGSYGNTPYGAASGGYDNTGGGNAAGVYGRGEDGGGGNWPSGNFGGSSFGNNYGDAGVYAGNSAGGYDNNGYGGGSGGDAGPYGSNAARDYDNGVGGSGSSFGDRSSGKNYGDAGAFRANAASEYGGGSGGSFGDSSSVNNYGAGGGYNGTGTSYRNAGSFATSNPYNDGPGAAGFGKNNNYDSSAGFGSGSRYGSAAAAGGRQSFAGSQHPGSAMANASDGTDTGNGFAGGSYGNAGSFATSKTYNDGTGAAGFGKNNKYDSSAGFGSSSRYDSAASVGNQSFAGKQHPGMVNGSDGTGTGNGFAGGSYGNAGSYATSNTDKDGTGAAGFGKNNNYDSSAGFGSGSRYGSAAAGGRQCFAGSQHPGIAMANASDGTDTGNGFAGGSYGNAGSFATCNSYNDGTGTAGFGKSNKYDSSAGFGSSSRYGSAAAVGSQSFASSQHPGSAMANASNGTGTGNDFADRYHGSGGQFGSNQSSNVGQHGRDFGGSFDEDFRIGNYENDAFAGRA